MVMISFIFGCCWASFMTTLTWRTISSKEKKSRFSICDACGHPLFIRDRLPIIGYCLQRGSCRHCQRPINRYWTVAEVLNGLAWVGMPLWSPLDYLLFFIIDSTVLVICTQDWFQMEFSWPLLIGYLPLHWLTVSPPLRKSTIILTLLLFTIYLWPGLGNGDVDWMIITNLCCGFSITSHAILFGCLLALTYTVGNRQRLLPFLPFLCSGLLISLVTQKAWQTLWLPGFLFL